MTLKELIEKLRALEKEHSDHTVRVMTSEGFADVTDIDADDDKWRGVSITIWIN